MKKMAESASLAYVRNEFYCDGKLIGTSGSKRQVWRRDDGTYYIKSDHGAVRVHPSGKREFFHRTHTRSVETATAALQAARS